MFGIPLPGAREFKPGEETVIIHYANSPVGVFKLLLDGYKPELRKDKTTIKVNEVGGREQVEITGNGLYPQKYVEQTINTHIAPFQSLFPGLTTRLKWEPTK